MKKTRYLGLLIALVLVVAGVVIGRNIKEKEKPSKDMSELTEVAEETEVVSEEQQVNSSTDVEWQEIFETGVADDYELIDTQGNIFPFEESIKYGSVTYEFVDVKLIPSAGDVATYIPEYDEKGLTTSLEHLETYDYMLWCFDFYVSNDNSYPIDAWLSKVRIAITEDDKIVAGTNLTEHFYVGGDAENIGTKSVYKVTLQPGERKHVYLATYNAGDFGEDSYEFYVKLEGAQTDGNMYETIEDDTGHIYLKFAEGTLLELASEE